MAEAGDYYGAQIRYANEFQGFRLAGAIGYERVTDVAIFWRRWQQGSCDAVFVERYGVSYVIAEAGAAPAHCGLDPVVRVNRDGPHATFGTSSRLHAR